MEKEEKNQSQRSIRYLCLNCKYSFSIKENSTVARRCPYCGSENIVELKEKDADEILRESTENIYDF